MGRKLQKGPLKYRNHQKWRIENAQMLKAWEKYGDATRVSLEIGMPVSYVRYGLWRLWGIGERPLWRQGE